nr:movement protein [Rubber tree latent virus 1]
MSLTPTEVVPQTTEGLLDEEDENFTNRVGETDSFQMQQMSLAEVFQHYKGWKNIVKPRVRIVEETHPMAFTDQIVDISLLQGLLDNVPKGLKFLHIGAIQVGLIPLFSFKKNIAACVALMDCRFNEDFNAVTGVVGARLNSGPVWIDHHPGYCLSLSDKHLKNALKLKIKLQGLGSFKKGSEFLSLCVRLYVKYSNSSTSKVVYQDDEKILSSFQTTADGTVQERESEYKDLISDPSFWNFSNSSTSKVVHRSDIHQQPLQPPTTPLLTGNLRQNSESAGYRPVSRKEY